ncbi:MAG: hypothetical protein U0520_03075 [Candidatus Saccharimonadales bacterium]
MSNIEFGERWQDFEGAECELVASVARQAWEILASFGEVDTTEVDAGEGDVEFSGLATPTIYPLSKGRELYCDQVAYDNEGEIIMEPGIVVLHILHYGGEKEASRTVFRLETHLEGAAVFDSCISIATKITDPEELLLLSVKLEGIKQAFWADLPIQPPDSTHKLHLFGLPVSHLAAETAAFLEEGGNA